MTLQLRTPAGTVFATIYNATWATLTELLPGREHGFDASVMNKYRKRLDALGLIRFQQDRYSLAPAEPGTLDDVTGAP